ncbi:MULTISPECIES: DUF2628 domain-containing protein [Xanthomonas]|jgi:hypothetical protein|uniref:DUF2628 domain-containing protein n=8 Tax=Xanthomonas TaxID=338 RepID=A0AAP4K7V6_9XANT|nr:MULTISPECIES: DUF2628 domain-containing protein [Xanthomonas]GAE52666.1 hypothetical protein XPU_4198 [Xanthomonas arboricola pv. pruni str. MAFF 311562]GAE53888.1 hypothetical protein XPR_0523 [Xanthomonas arboricola pv. pruni MAFF 301420]GAE61165.1 hypothetical protein XPN_3071 [Xanthomonas arboricola pv. pruni MAFF 301427]AKC80193.1 membrane protein [Xanthomonas arboricola]AKU51783.1 hypothetical protein AKJ12_19785 [Xanthomonas arboricola pv. juglandis]
MDTFDRTQLSPKWQFRFDFFDRHGGPKDPSYKNALKTLSFGEKVKVGMNFYAFFFGVIYFFIIGLWRKALSLIGISVVVSIVASFLPAAFQNVLWLPLSLLTGMIANYAYYLDKVKGSTSWNPFEGMRWI